MPKSFTLIVCTYMRPEALLKLLNSVKLQIVYPDEILIIDGSTNENTAQLLEANSFKNLKYFKVNQNNRGLTKQRNFGIEKVSETSEVVCFLDDDVILEEDFFKNLIETYDVKKEALSVGGYITNEVEWLKAGNEINSNNFYYDDWMRTEPARFKIRRWFGLQPDKNPGFLPTFAHGRSIGFIPPSNKIYPVEFLMGCAFSFKTSILKKLKFSTYFEGYGLYEDLDYCLRVAKLGEVYVNTAAKLAHYHEAGGRPNKYDYGKMIIRNNWYVWHVKYPKPNLKSRFKWHFTVLLLIALRSTNIVNSSKKKEALTECVGRVVGLLSLVFNKPRIE